MKTKIDNRVYVCPSCGKVYDWDNNVIEEQACSLYYADVKYSAKVKICGSCLENFGNEVFN
jgi:hypothetical protein